MASVVSGIFLLLLLLVTSLGISHVVESVKLRILYKQLRKKGVLFKDLSLRDYKEMRLYCIERDILEYAESLKNQINIEGGDE